MLHIGKGLFKANVQDVLLEESIEANLATADYSLLQLQHEGRGHHDKRHSKPFFNYEMNMNVNVQVDFCETFIYNKAHNVKEIINDSVWEGSMRQGN